MPLNGFPHDDANGYSPIVGPNGERLRRDIGTATDPHSDYDGFAVPHALQFSSRFSSPRGYWRDAYDEALKNSRNDALTMEADLGIMGMVQERQLAFTTLPWHIHVPDENDPTQAAVKAHITKTIESCVGPEESLLKLRQSQSWALWFGRQAAQCVWRWNRMAGVKTLTLAEWMPTRGDKISHLLNGTPCVDVYAAATQGETFPDSDITTTTNGARALVLNGDMSWGWRMRFILHAHELIDRDFFDAEAAEAVFGVGIRSRIYYLNWIDKEWLARTCDWVDQVGLGVNLWYYDASNAAARLQAQKAAKEVSDRTNILVPRWGNEKHAALERLEVSGTGAQLLLTLRQDIREQMRLYICGQTMSTGGSKGEGGDMGGSHRAQFAADTKTQIRNYDAKNLDATLTGSMKNPGLVSMIQFHTFPETWPGPNNPQGFRASFVSELEDKESKERLEAIKAVWEMGVDVKADDLRSAAGIGKPTEGDEIIAGQQAQPAPGMPGQEGAPQPGQEQPQPAEQVQPYAQGGLFDESEHPRNEGGEFTSKGGGTAAEKPAGQKRAKKGGEIGPNNEWYPGGAYIATTELKKMAKGKRGSGKQQIAPYTWEVPEPGKVPIWRVFGGIEGVLGDKPFSGVSDKSLKYLGLEGKKEELEKLIERFKAGERYINLHEDPRLQVSQRDVRAALEAGVPVDGSIIDQHPALAAEYGVKRATEENPTSALHSIPEGGLGKVGGFTVRRTGADEWRIDREGKGEKALVKGDAATIQAHIDREASSAKLYGRKLPEALERAKGYSEPSWTDSEGQQKAARAFGKLPKGAVVVSLEDDTYGRVGNIVKDDDGRNRVRLEGEAGFASNHVEPLDPKLSWRAGEREERPKQATMFQRQDYAAEAGRWITIGGHKGEDGKKHGGTPVYIENGRITKGAPALSGKKIDALKEEAEPTTRQKEVHEAKGYNRAKWAKQAKAEEIKPEHLHQLAAEMVEHDREGKVGLTKMMQRAREISKNLGSDLTTIKARAARGIDADAVRGLDDVAQTVAAEYPEFFHDDPDNPEERLLDYLLAGNPEPMSEDDAYEQAFDHLRQHRGGGGIAPRSDEPIPFWAFDDIDLYGFDADQPRDESGRWTKTIGEMEAAHPFPSGSTPLPGEGFSPEVIAAGTDPAYVAARKAWDDHTAAWHRANTARLVRTMLTKPPPKLVPLPPEHLRLGQRVSLARRAMEAAHTAQGELGFLASAFGRHHAAVTGGDAERGEALAAARSEAGRRYEAAYAHALRHFEGLPSDVRERAMRKLGPAEEYARYSEQYAGQHSPAGGVTLQGKFYPGGEFIPGDVVEKASPEEKTKLGPPRGVTAPVAQPAPAASVAMKAPSAGVVIGGKFFAGGSVIPADVLATATDKEKGWLRPAKGKATAPAQAPPAAPPLAQPVATPAPAAPQAPQAAGDPAYEASRTAVLSGLSDALRFAESVGGVAGVATVYHQARRRDPSLTPERFRAMLDDMNRKGDLELHVLNEVRGLSPEDQALMPVNSTGKVMGFVGGRTVQHARDDVPAYYGADAAGREHKESGPGGGQFTGTGGQPAESPQQPPGNARDAIAAFRTLPRNATSESVNAALDALETHLDDMGKKDLQSLALEVFQQSGGDKIIRGKSAASIRQTIRDHFDRLGTSILQTQFAGSDVLEQYDFDPSQARDESGKWSHGAGHALVETARKAGHAVATGKAKADAARKRLGDAAYEKLSPRGRKAWDRVWGWAKAAEHVTMSGFRAAKALALDVGRERGLSEEQVKTLGRVLAAVDLTLAWTVNAPTAAVVTGSLTAAKVASWLPVASLAYVAYSGARNPIKTARAAIRAVSNVRASAVAHNARLDERPGSDREAALTLADWLEDNSEDDWNMACLHAAIDVCRGDLAEALRLADAATEEDGPEHHAANGGWVTIGGGPGPHGETHAGGTPVKVGDGGRVAAGPKSLEGKPLESGQEPPPGFHDDSPTAAPTVSVQDAKQALKKLPGVGGDRYTAVAPMEYVENPPFDYEQLDAALQAGKVLEADVPLGELKTDQIGVERDGVMPYLNDPLKQSSSQEGQGRYSGRLIVVRAGDKSYLVDGNHRATAGFLRGMATMPAYVVDLPVLAAAAEGEGPAR